MGLNVILPIKITSEPLILEKLCCGRSLVVLRSQYLAKEPAKPSGQCHC